MIRQYLYCMPKCIGKYEDPNSIFIEEHFGTEIGVHAVVMFPIYCTRATAVTPPIIRVGMDATNFIVTLLLREILTARAAVRESALNRHRLYPVRCLSAPAA